MKKAVVLVEKCRRCPRSFVMDHKFICLELDRKSVNPDTIDPSCPLEDVEEEK